MEKNWIEEIKEFIRKAMNKGFNIDGCSYISYYNGDEHSNNYDFNINSEINISINSVDNVLVINTSKRNGHFRTDIELTKRDCLELDALILAIEEYREDIAIEEFNNFFKDEDEKPKDINDLDEDD